MKKKLFIFSNENIYLQEGKFFQVGRESVAVGKVMGKLQVEFKEEH